ncbi:MAG: hypothetical protein J6Q13_00755 [Clostridia bacterium]|nr:hypothetical protein [Clostridia bacterium]
MDNKKKRICLTKKELSELENQYEDLSFDSDKPISPSRFLLDALYKKARAEFKKADAEKEFYLLILKIEFLGIYFYPINDFKDDSGDPFWLEEYDIKKITKNFNEFIYNDKRLIELTDEKMFEYIATLNSEEQKILEMLYAMGKYDKHYTIEEIGKEFGKTKEQIKVIMVRIMIRLRKKLIAKKCEERKEQRKVVAEDGVGV